MTLLAPTLSVNLSVNRMAQQLTTPFARGADTLMLTLLAQGSATQAAIAAYDFRQHQALFDQWPAPRYVLAPRQDVIVDTQVTLAFTAQPNGSVLNVVVMVPAGTLAGSSLPVDLGAHEGPFTQLTQLAMTPAAPDGEAAGWWQVTALLGNLAKLLWALGWERDHIRRQFMRTRAQRQLSAALGLSLDLLGYDLGVPRFPPLPYSFDPDTLALYHLNDLPGANPPVEDIIGRYPGRPGHDGTVSGAVMSGVLGRFGNGFALQAANAVVEIPDHPDFALPAAQDFTVECFVQPQRATPDGHLLSKHPDLTTTQAGWALSVGDFGRGLPLNPRLLVSDGANAPVTLFADVSLPTDSFTHLAAVIDRQRNEARLYLDGQLRAVASLAGIGALTNSAPVRIGDPSAALLSVVEEVRLSSVARASFHPALGESDASYRQRLRFFKRWVLPTPANLLAMLNEAVGPVNGDLTPLIVNDANTTIVGGARLITVQPLALLPGECMDDQGNRRVNEADVVGTAAAETLFDPAYLIVHNNATVVYVPPAPRLVKAGELPPDPHKMQIVVERALNQLLALSAAEAGAGQLRVESAFDPQAADLRVTGRGLLLRHTTIALGRLAALAHRAGFAFVCYRSDLGAVYAACAQDEYIEIVGPTPGADGSDLLVGDTVSVTIRPSLPVDTTYRWLTIACGAGRATLKAGGASTTVTVQATAPGELTLKLDATRRRRTVSATRVLRIGLQEVSNNVAIAADGTLGVSETAAGAPEDAFFQPVFLVKHADARATYGADPNNQLMQAALAARLTQLLDLIAKQGVAGTLQVVSAYTPGATDLAGVGRALTVQHPALPPGQLAALAYAVGFSVVRRQDPVVLLRQSAADLVAINGAQSVEEGASIPLRVALKAGDIAPGVQLNWTLRANGSAQASLSSTTQPNTTLTGQQAGQILVQALYLLNDNPAPYTFEVRLKPALEAAGAIIRKEQYDLIMNMLNAFHPIGVEVITPALRARVIEIQGDALEANPDYTYPKFRVRSPLPGSLRKE